MEYTEKFLYQSNQWYNDGLKKANIRDLSGAILSLKRSLQYNRNNIPARNLLGLIYYGRGEVAEALVEWIISRSIKSHKNIATYYIKKVQESSSELETINEAIKKYNQSLVYCEQGGEDLAAIQLRKVVASHPTFLRAYQLLALIYMQTEQYAKARQMIRRAHKLDTTNEITLRYMHELKQLHTEKASKLREGKSQTVSYKLGNETIIQPVSGGSRERAPYMNIVTIGLGVLIGAVVVWFLITPVVRENVTKRTNKEIRAYSEQIVSLQSEIDNLTQELEEFQSQNEATAAELEKAKNEKAVLGELLKNEEAVLALLQSQVDAGETEKAASLYKVILAMYPNTDYAAKAKNIVEPPKAEESADDEQGGSTGTSGATSQETE